MTSWNFANVWDVVAETVPERPALQQGGVRLDWHQFERRAASLAGRLTTCGLGRQAKVAQYLYNCPAYLESVYACLKAGLVPVNTNYRYADDELVYLFDNCDAEAVIFHASFSEIVARVRSRLRGVKAWIVVDDGGENPDWAIPYEQAANSPPLEVPPGRSGDDMLFIYTGGTTGMPKGVMWRQDDLFAILNRTGQLRYPDEGDLDVVRAVISGPSKRPPPRYLPGPPLMHSTGLFAAMSVLSSGGSVVMPESRHLDAEALLNLIEAEHVTEMSIVGDVFAKPILAALDARPDRWDLSSLWLIVSSGVMWSAKVKDGLLRHNPKMTLIDTLGASEAIGIARSMTRTGTTSETAGFTPSHDTKVLTEAGREVVPGSDEQGRLALRGRGPIGYYKDPEKSAKTFAVIGGERWTMPGDFAIVREDGTVQLLGRGSGCINTGGEKVFPEEVEEVLKLHPAIADAVVVGLPDERFGEQVVAVIERTSGARPAEDHEIIEWVRGQLATYKTPRDVVYVETIGRTPSGKVDYPSLRAHAIAIVGSRSDSPDSQAD
jgi:acyl-CoA synthetase (AMP-forming)/AMP-acid ligase II